MVWNWDVVDFGIWAISSAITVVVYYRARSFPYAAVASLLLSVVVMLFFWRDFGTCPDNDMKRVLSPVTGKLEPALYSWGCSGKTLARGLRAFGSTGTSVISFKMFSKSCAEMDVVRDEEMGVDTHEVSEASSLESKRK